MMCAHTPPNECVHTLAGEAGIRWPASALAPAGKERERGRSDEKSSKALKALKTPDSAAVTLSRRAEKRAQEKCNPPTTSLQRAWTFLSKPRIAIGYRLGRSVSDRDSRGWNNSPTRNPHKAIVPKEKTWVLKCTRNYNNVHNS